MRSKHEIAHVVHKLGDNIHNLKLNSYQHATLRAIGHCRTQALGGHVDACTACGTMSISYNSCRNRHCPKCQGHKREQWIQAREAELLPVPYFHIVFTLPSELNTLAMHQPKLVYDALFASAWQTLQCFGQKENLQLGMVSVLHTWGQNLSLHPHLHCIVPGGGLTTAKRWRAIKGNGKFLFSVKALSAVYRAKYVAALRKGGFTCKATINALFNKNWVVYAKRPFASAKFVIEYLGRYTHKVAISNARLTDISNSTVTFSYKDYKQHGTKKIMTLSHAEFIRRFAIHILPKRFVRIRHYGMLSSTSKTLHLYNTQQQLKVQPQAHAPPPIQLRRCTHCKQHTLTTVCTFDKRGPPMPYIIVKIPAVSATS